MRAATWLFLLLASGAFAQEEGDLVSRAELVHEIAADKTHTVARAVIAVDEGVISCKPSSQPILVVHYRGAPTAQFSMNDDRIVVALEQRDRFRILKVLESDSTIIDQGTISETDFEEEFIKMDALQFLYVRTKFSGSGNGVLHEVYSISSDGRLSLIPFEDVSKSKLLKAKEELRNGANLFLNGVFSFESGVYKSEDGECCPSNGWFHAQFKLLGEFKENTSKHVFEPNFKFAVEKEWRSDER